MMKKKYRALMLDVDGTLMRNDHDALPTARVYDALKKAQEKIHVGIATGRPLHHLHRLFEHLPLSGPSIVNGGIQIIDAGSQKILQEQRINQEDIIPVLTIAQELGINVDLVEEKQDRRYFSGYPIGNPYGLYTQSIEISLADVLIRQLSHIPTIIAHKTSSWTSTNVHVAINHVNASKHHGIVAVANILDIKPEEIIGVGDHYNDFPLLMASGLKVAMGNAVEDLKAIADYIAPSVDEDGVADVIEKFVLS